MWGLGGEWVHGEYIHSLVISLFTDCHYLADRFLSSWKGVYYVIYIYIDYYYIKSYVGYYWATWTIIGLHGLLIEEISF